MKPQHPTEQEEAQFSISAYRGIEIGLGASDPLAVMAAKLELQHPGHLILIQAGTFLHSFDRSAYALHVLKKYKLKLIGTTDEPHLRVGFPAGKAERRLWSIMDEFQIPYVVLLGNQKDGYKSYGSKRQDGNISILSAVTDDVVRQVIIDLRQIGAVNTAATKQLLANPNASGFRLKEQAQELDTYLLHSIIKMPRDIRTTYGENLRQCLSRIIRNTFAYGSSGDKSFVLAEISADVDVLKYRLTQAPQLKSLKFAFAHAVNLAVELGRLVGGLSSKQGARP